MDLQKSIVEPFVRIEAMLEQLLTELRNAKKIDFDSGSDHFNTAKKDELER